MHGYRVTFWGTDGRREGTFPLRAVTDRDAFDIGQRMLKQSPCAAVEIWRDTSLVARVDREDAGASVNEAVNA